MLHNFFYFLHNSHVLKNHDKQRGCSSKHVDHVTLFRKDVTKSGDKGQTFVLRKIIRN